MAAPAFVAAVPLLLGVLLGAGGYVIHPLPGLAAAWLVSAAALAARRPVLLLPAAVAGFLFAGLYVGDRAARAAAQPPLLAWHLRETPDRLVRVVGVAREDAVATAAGVSITLDVRAVDEEAMAGGVRLSVAGATAAGAAPAWRAGRTIAATAALRTPLDYRDPGVASERERLARGGLVLLGAVKSAALVSVQSRGTLVSEAAAALRARVRAAARAAVGRWSPASAGVVTAILIGDRSGLAPDNERRLQAAGTYHVIAISGGNIAILTALLVVVGRAARLPPRRTAAGSIAVLAFYGYLAGLAPSVARATIAGVILLTARTADHRGSALNAIAVAASLAAVAAPLTLLDPGFVLSFAATFAILVAAQRLGRGAATRDPARGRVAAAIAASWSAARLLGTATLCAEVALAPVGARLFGRVSFAGLLLNFAAIPLMSIIQAAGTAAVVFDSIWTLPAAAAGWLAHAATTALLRSASLVDAAPWLVVDLPPPGWPLVVVWYGAWTAALLQRTRRGRLALVALALAVGAVAIAGPLPLRAARVAAAPPGWTRVVFLDVGQGDATLLQIPGADPLLVDAGGVAGSGFDLGRRVTLPAAWAFGVTRLGALVVTHGDPDHIGGMPPLLRALRPRGIWDGVPVPPHVPLRQLQEAARRSGIPWLTRRAGTVVALGPARIRVLNPPDPDWERRKVRNDDSIVLEVRIGGVAFVLPGDITAAVEPAIAAAFDPAPLAIVKAPHHGSAGSSSPGFIDALHPAVVVFSAGQRNPFGHPAPVVVDRYGAAGAAIFTTADDGAVVIDTDGREVVVWTWTGRRGLLHARTVEHKDH